MARNLYARFHKDESWDSPHNRALIGEIPSYFQDPSAAAKKGETCYLGVAGEDCAFNGKEVKPLPQGSWTVIAVITAKKSVPWTKPEDVPLKEVEASIRWGDDGTHGIAWNGYYTGWGKVPTPGRPETIARFTPNDCMALDCVVTANPVLPRGFNCVYHWYILRRLERGA